MGPRQASDEVEILLGKQEYRAVWAADEQAAIVDDAITLARSNPLADTGLNENSNGNALALICEQWLRAQNGNS